MKIIDIYNKVANGEEVPHFIIDEIEYYIGTDGFVKDAFGEEVEWTIDKQWLNEEVQILEEVEDKEYEDIEELTQECFDHWTQAKKINALIRNQKYILEQLNKESK